MMASPAVGSALAPLMSSKSDEWRTPLSVFEALHAEFGFTVDAAATPTNTLLDRYWTDAMSEQWAGERVWCNPPYSRGQQRQFIDRAPDAELAVLLLSARPDTRAWHDVIFQFADEVRFVRGRIRFTGAAHSAPFPNAIVVFRGRGAGPPRLRTATLTRG